MDMVEPKGPVPFGRYLLTGRLGRGGMAEVFAARQTGLGNFDRPVVLKLIRQDVLARLEEAGAMLLSEARIAAQIAHPNVVHIYEVGEEQGVLYIAMEYLRGVTLADLLAQLAARNARMPADLAAAIMSQVCAGLHAAHELRTPTGEPMGVVHRDVSPSNIMVSPEGVVKVIDFGIARAELESPLARLEGKPLYMSPEQARCEPLDRRSDLFSLGLVLYELCSGVRVYGRPELAELAAVLHAVTHEVPPPLDVHCADAPPALTALLIRTLAQERGQRPASAAELQEVLEQVVAIRGRFGSPAAIGRYLQERGLHLQSRPVRPLDASSVPGSQPGSQPRTPQPRVPTLRVAEGEAPVLPLPPPPGGAVQVPLPSGAAGAAGALLSVVYLNAESAREPVPLPLSQALPAPLALCLSAGAARVEVLAGDEAEAPGRRPGLYLDARRPDTRCPFLIIEPSVRPDPGAAFDVGHRRVQVQRVAYSSERGRRALTPGGELLLEAPESAQRLIVFSTLHAGAAHLCCVVLE